MSIFWKFFPFVPRLNLTFKSIEMKNEISKWQSQERIPANLNKANTTTIKSNSLIFINWLVN